MTRVFKYICILFLIHVINIYIRHTWYRFFTHFCCRRLLSIVHFSAALEAVTGVTATANGWDARTIGYGCVPKGCLPANVLEPSIDDDSRWSCLPSRQGVEVCELIFDFDEPQDIFEIRVAMWKGDRRSRTIDVWVDGVLSTRAETSGVTLGYEVYYLSATQASSIVLQQAGPLEEWLSITGASTRFCLFVLKHAAAQIVYFGLSLSDYRNNCDHRPRRVGATVYQVGIEMIVTDYDILFRAVGTRVFSTFYQRC